MSLEEELAFLKNLPLFEGVQKEVSTFQPIAIFGRCNYCKNWVRLYYSSRFKRYLVDDHAHDCPRVTLPQEDLRFLTDIIENYYKLLLECPTCFHQCYTDPQRTYNRADYLEAKLIGSLCGHYQPVKHGWYMFTKPDKECYFMGVSAVHT